jgi:hypothetical protein
MTSILRIVTIAVVLLGFMSFSYAIDASTFVEQYKVLAYPKRFDVARCSTILRDVLTFDRDAAEDVPFERRRLANVVMRVHGCFDKWSSLTDLEDRMRPIAEVPVSIPARLHVSVTDKILYIGIGTFMDKSISNDLYADIENLGIGQLRSIKTVIVDLRRNVGGFLNQGAEILDALFAPRSGVPFMRIDATKYQSVHTTTVPGLLAGKKIFVAVDSASASMSEFFAMSLRHELAKENTKIIGMRTFGKAIVQDYYPEHANAGEGRLKITSG